MTGFRILLIDSEKVIQQALFDIFLTQQRQFGMQFSTIPPWVNYLACVHLFGEKGPPDTKQMVGDFLLSQRADFSQSGMKQLSGYEKAKIHAVYHARVVTIQGGEVFGLPNGQRFVKSAEAERKLIEAYNQLPPVRSTSIHLESYKDLQHFFSECNNVKEPVQVQVQE